MRRPLPIQPLPVILRGLQRLVHLPPDATKAAPFLNVCRALLLEEELRAKADYDAIVDRLKLEMEKTNRSTSWAAPMMRLSG